MPVRKAHLASQHGVIMFQSYLEIYVGIRTVNLGETQTVFILCECNTHPMVLYLAQRGEGSLEEEGTEKTSMWAIHCGFSHPLFWLQFHLKVLQIFFALLKRVYN